ncbi:hypothetical protein POX_a01574 [Penicillium oxalicum]|uniref:hypothetical protein n=1 Tax=Penicillium oxalicum TaxID=69781 RepID=UPI0020B6E450|nr:hypothetical protein POX_a01574 [Penicillium oxalicum]KAI2794973.1 hypothetical protein POX_a01574 [Penicillium oxalicum]
MPSNGPNKSNKSNNYPARSQSLSSGTTSSSRETHHSDDKRRGRRFTNPLVSKLSRSSQKSPASLDLPKSHRRHRSASVESNHHDIARRSFSDSSTLTSSSLDINRAFGSQSPTRMAFHPLGSQSPRQEQAGHTQSETIGRKHCNDYRRYNGTVQQYGRHSNDWLFGGFSVRETVRDGIDKLRHHGKES